MAPLLCHAHQSPLHVAWPRPERGFSKTPRRPETCVASRVWCPPKCVASGKVRGVQSVASAKVRGVRQGACLDATVFCGCHAQTPRCSPGRHALWHTPRPHATLFSGSRHGAMGGWLRWGRGTAEATGVWVFHSDVAPSVLGTHVSGQVERASAFAQFHFSTR